MLILIAEASYIKRLTLNVIGIACAAAILFGCAAAGRYAADIGRDAVIRAYHGIISRTDGMLARIEELIGRSLNLNGSEQNNQ